jgi:hypothetical protein
MPNDYSIAIHDYISDKIEKTNQKIAKADDRTEVLFQRGQLGELHWIRRYLAETSDLKDFTYYQKQ